MKFLIVFVALFAVALAAPAEHHHEAEHHHDHHDHHAVIVKQDSDVHPEGYNFVHETSDGTHHESEGHLKDLGSEHEAIVVHGSYSWVDEKTGEHFEVKYVADEHGYQPEGAHLPKA